LNLGQVTAWDDSWWLVVDTDLNIDLVISVGNHIAYLETSWAPVDELNGSLGLDVGN